jgi:hypothetical protein
MLRPRNENEGMNTFRTVAEKIVAGARAQIGDVYAPDYVSIPYPNGDVPKGTGACTDVIVRAFRHAGFDLQRLVHEDMRAHFNRYPRRWGLRRPDSSIDHRRVPNLRVFFARHGHTLSVDTHSAPARTSWRPGDVVTWELPNGRDHCGVVSDARNANGLPLVVHNLARCEEADCLTAWKITGHYRYPRRQEQR